MKSLSKRPILSRSATKTTVAAFVAFTLAACATTTPTNDMLEHARVAVSSAEHNPQVAGQAAVDLQTAEQALNSGDEMLKAGRPATEVNHEAYLAERFALAAQKGAELRVSEKEIADAETRRNAVLLAAREHETTRANDRAQMKSAEADAARSDANVARGDAIVARSNEDAARSNADAARSNADVARNDAIVARSNEDAARSSADVARSDADSARTDARHSDELAQISAQQNDASRQRADRLESALADLQAKKTDRGLVITLGDVLFATGQADLKPGARRSLDRLANFMQQYPQRTVQIEGFTDSVGTEDYNQRLSEHRADAVRDALTDRGVASNRIRTRGFGKSSPVADNDNAGGRQQNRRVEVIISEGDDRTATRIQ